MKGKFEKYLILLFAVFLTACNSDDFDWNKTFESDSTEPMGTYVLRRELPKIFPKSEITDIKKSTYTFFYEEPENGNYFYIHTGTSLIPDTAWKEILHFVNKGGTAFISSYIFQKSLMDSLGFETSGFQILGEKETIKYTINKPNGVDSFIFNGKGKNKIWFSDYDPNYTEILGYSDYGDSIEPNFLKVYYGKGYFLLHTEPVAFSNYEMLKSNHFNYVTDVFSYLDDTEIYWDNYRTYRRNREHYYDNGGFFDSLSFIFKHKSLRMAFLIMLMLGLFYLVFNSKRRQRAQEIILPYSNYTLDFTKTLSELYRYNLDHTALTKYKINYFLEQLRIKFNITAKETETDFSDLLIAKSGVDKKLCQELATTVNNFRKREYLNKQDFLKIQSLIELFNRKIKFNGR